MTVIDDVRQRAAHWYRRTRVLAAAAKPRRHVLLFSHMRSYSSLIGHILGSHPEIDGYSELHQSYESDLDLVRQAMRVYELNDRHLDGRYVFDKVLHGHHKINPQVLGRSNVVALFTLRRPEATLRSSIAMARRRKKPDWKGNPDKLAGYYERRAAHLVELAGAKPQQSAVFEAEAIIDRSDEFLAGLSELLRLKTPLTQGYDTFSHTGRAAFGDPTEVIKSGHIVRDRKRHEDIELDPDLVARLEAVRSDALAELRRRCEVTL